VDRGVHTNLAFSTYFAAEQGVAPANDPPWSLRLSDSAASAPAKAPPTVEEMIASCKEGIYVNRFTQLSLVDRSTGTYTGFTNGGCFAIRDGKIVKSVKDFRFVESPWLFLSRVEAIGTSERTAFGYAPWQHEWPVEPTIVPPLMIRDFNFTGLAGAV